MTSDGNKSKRYEVSRRAFLAGSAVGAFGLALGAGKGALSQEVDAPDKSKVVVVRAPSLPTAEKGQVPALVQDMVNKSVTELTGKSSVAEAWRELVSPSETIAIKINGLFRRATTRPVVVDAKASLEEPAIGEERHDKRDGARHEYQRQHGSVLAIRHHPGFRQSLSSQPTRACCDKQPTRYRLSPTR